MNESAQTHKVNSCPCMDVVRGGWSFSTSSPKEIRNDGQRRPPMGSSINPFMSITGSPTRNQTKRNLRASDRPINRHTQTHTSTHIDVQTSRQACWHAVGTCRSVKHLRPFQRVNLKILACRVNYRSKPIISPVRLDSTLVIGI